MRINEELKKYCYNCGKIIAFSDVWCKYCGEDLKHYEKQSKIRCRYCLTEIPSGAKYCKTCQTKNTFISNKEDKKMLQQLKIAADKYLEQKSYQDFLEKKYNHLKFEMNIVSGYGNFSKAKKIFIHTDNEKIAIKTFEYGQDNLYYSDIISCRKITKDVLIKDYDIKSRDFLVSNFIVLDTVKGQIILEDNRQMDELINGIYFHLQNNIVEFKDVFFNADYEVEINKEYEKYNF